MDQRFFVIKKINYLLISIEALNIYSQEYLYNDKNTKISKNIKNIHVHIINNKYYNILPIIIYIFFLYQIINDIIIQKLANDIVIDFSNYMKTQLVKQYLNKFNYIYYKVYNYYNFNDNFNINEIAIINLYIIIKIYKKEGLFFLIKYLYKIDI
uniref:Uncharacterized protein n=1 Tax=Apoglossum ruscifolium TaxID=167976 RepID=A0A4D6WMU0_9FLOR|nr:hypothetical protein [Apoglossum ruscifolium]